ncbi:hypothetical protein [Sphingomonas sp.]|uniref:hypothetical protein n=1 Tax=Sphingomonas sp. TaxID=28214 RepID=UPI001B149460|nr:hypothetical protein [Sphingomonas sp.]MBO9715184.1 hypothetical protein [Sphingomonas sp.]
MIAFNPAEIVELGTQVATYGSAGLLEMHADELFDLLAGIVLLVIELLPPTPGDQ